VDYRLQAVADSACKRNFYRQGAPCHVLLNFDLFAGMSKDSGDMKEVLLTACSLCLPDWVRDDIMKSVSEKTKPPSKGDISRARFCIDAAFTLWRRCVSRHAPSMARYTTWDSSPQYRQNYVIVLLRSICRNVLPELLFTFHALADVWTCTVEENNDENFDVVKGANRMTREEGLMTKTRENVEEHAVPCALAGFGTKSFAQFFDAFVHALRLEQFTNAEVSTMISDDQTLGSQKMLEIILLLCRVSLCFTDPSFQGTICICKGGVRSWRQSLSCSKCSEVIGFP